MLQYHVAFYVPRASDRMVVAEVLDFPGVFSQGESLDELEENIRDAYKLMMDEEQETAMPAAHTKEIQVEV